MKPQVSCDFTPGIYRVFFVRLDVLRAVLMKPQVSCHVTPCRVVNSYRIFEGARCIRVWVVLHCQILKMKAASSSETPVCSVLYTV